VTLQRNRPAALVGLLLTLLVSSPSLAAQDPRADSERPVATEVQVNQASVLSWAPLLGLGLVLVVVGGVMRRRSRQDSSPDIGGGGNVRPLQQQRRPPGPAARTG